MAWFHESQDHLPLTWWKGKPIYLAAILALAGVASMIVTAILGPVAASLFGFSFENLFQHFYVWTPVTYALVNYPSFWLLVGCFLLWRFGEELERHLGRRAFVRLIIGLLLISPVLISLLGAMGVGGKGQIGMHQLTFGIFVAFATLYPRAQISLIIVNIDAWVLAAVLVGVSALADIAMRDWVSLLLLAGQVGMAYGFVRHEQGQLTMPSFKTVLPARAAKQALPTVRTVRAAKREKPAATPGQLKVDDILDKISREGMHSLTPEERIILERASDDLQKRKR